MLFVIEGRPSFAWPLPGDAPVNRKLCTYSRSDYTREAIILAKRSVCTSGYAYWPIAGRRKKRRAPQSPGAGAGRPTRPPFSGTRRGPSPQKRSEAPKLRSSGGVPSLASFLTPRSLCHLFHAAENSSLDRVMDQSFFVLFSRSLSRTYFVAFCRRSGIA